MFVLLILLLSKSITFCNAKFELTPSVYDIATAKTLMGYAAIAYCPEFQIKAWKCEICDPSLGSNIQIFPNTKQKVYIVTNKKNAIIVAFQGTPKNNIDSWITNLNVDLESEPKFCLGCKVHEGILELHQSQVNDIKTAVVALLIHYPGSHIYVTGHSLGGALGMLFAFHLLKNNIVPNAASITVYAYGVPRTGNDKWAAEYIRVVKNSYRMVSGADIVPHLPPKLLGYRSSGLLYYCEKAGSTECKAMPGEDDGGLLHISIPDHKKYLGFDTDEYSSTGNLPTAGCKAV